MKICAIICEFNPFHNGHAYLIGQARRLSGCDALVCVMSGQFTQRGEMCREDKFARAEHAVRAGADAVVELYTPFAVAPAEIFSAGAVKLVCSLAEDNELSLCFGCETGGKEDFLHAARLLATESEEFKRRLAERLDGGYSHASAYAYAFEACGGNPSLLSGPNDVLGVEYCKAILRSGKPVEIIPVKRKGAMHGDRKIVGEYASATAIREALKPYSYQSALPFPDPAKGAMPEESYLSYTLRPDRTERFERLAADLLYLKDKSDIARTYGCSEGLENKLKSAAFGKTYTEAVAECVSRRYPASRIKRIACANLLGLYADETVQFLNAELPLKVLAVKRESADGLLPVLSHKAAESEYARRCADLTSAAYSLWRHLSPAPDPAADNPNEKMRII